MFYKTIFSTLLAFSITFFSLSAQAVETQPADNDTLPDAMQHQAQAPEVNFDHLRDPFTSFLTTVAMRGRLLLNQRRSKLANREPEPLEFFDLSALTLVGVFSIGEKRVAMVQDTKGKGYTVSRGNHMGKNNGRVEKIDVDTVYLVEQIVNPAGDIIDQQVKLTLKAVNL